VAGYNSSEAESFFNPDELKEKYNSLFSIKNIFIEKPSKKKSSKTQSLWVAGKIKELGIESLMLCLPPYHLVRAFLTLLQACKRKKIEEILIFPYAIPISMGEKIPMLIDGISYKQIDLLWAEVERITAYQAKDDVASYKIGKEYLLWLVKTLSH